MTKTQLAKIIKQVLDTYKLSKLDQKEPRRVLSELIAAEIIVALKENNHVTKV